MIDDPSGPPWTTISSRNRSLARSYQRLAGDRTDGSATENLLFGILIPAILACQCPPLLEHCVDVVGEQARVAGLVYITALAPDVDETSQSLQDKFPATDVFAHIEVADA